MDTMFSLFKARQNLELFDFFQRCLSAQEAECLLPAVGVVFGRISLLYDQGCVLPDLSLTRLVTFFLSAAASSSSVCVFVFDGPSQCTAL